MRNQRGFAPLELLGVMILLFAVGGWIANIYKFIQMLGGDVSAMFIGRIVGIFAAPLGAILGYF